MAIRLSGEELAKIKAGDFGHYVEGMQPIKADKTEKKHRGKGNPNGRPPSLVPRKNIVSASLSDVEAERLTEAAELLHISKSKVIARGIDRIHAEAIAAERKRIREDNPA